MCVALRFGGRRCKGRYTQNLDLDKIADTLETARSYQKNGPSESNKRRQAVKIAANNLPKLQNEARYLEDSIDTAMEKLIEYGQEHGLEEFQELSMETKNVYSKEGIEELLSDDELADVMKNSDSMTAFREANPELYKELSTPDGMRTKVILPDAETDEDFQKRYSRTVNAYAKDVKEAPDAQHVVKRLLDQVEKKRRVDALVSDHKEVLSTVLPAGDFVPYPSPKKGNSRGVRVYQAVKAPTPAKVRAWAKQQPDQEAAQKIVETMKVKTVDSAKVRKKYPQVAEQLTHPKTKLKINTD